MTTSRHPDTIVPDTVNPDTIVIIGGAGAIGTFFRQRLAPHAARLITLDRAATEAADADADALRVDVRALTPEARDALAQATLVISALPEPVTLDVLPDLLPLLQPSALFVDTLSVKSHAAACYRRLPPGPEILSINPMFGPSLDPRGQSIAIVAIHAGPRAAAFLDRLRSWGCRLVMLSDEQHDRATARLQALTHAAILSFGAALMMHGDLPPLALAPPPCRTLLSLLARIVSADAATYEDIQRGNPFAAAERRALADAAAAFQALTASDNGGFGAAVSGDAASGDAATRDAATRDAASANAAIGESASGESATGGAPPDDAAFAEQFAALRAYLDPVRAPLAAHCQRLFSVPPPASDPADA